MANDFPFYDKQIYDIMVLGPTLYPLVLVTGQFVGRALYQDVESRGNAVVSTVLITAENPQWATEGD